MDLLFAGIEPPTDKKIWIERKRPLTEEEENEPIDRPFQYVGECEILLLQTIALFDFLSLIFPLILSYR